MWFGTGVGAIEVEVLQFWDFRKPRNRQLFRIRGLRAVPVWLELSVARLDFCPLRVGFDAYGRVAREVPSESVKPDHFEATVRCIQGRRQRDRVAATTEDPKKAGYIIAQNTDYKTSSQGL